MISSSFLPKTTAGLALPLYSNNEVFLKDVVKALVGSAFETIDGIPDNHVIHDVRVVVGGCLLRFLGVRASLLTSVCRSYNNNNNRNGPASSPHHVVS